MASPPSAETAETAEAARCGTGAGYCGRLSTALKPVLTRVITFLSVADMVQTSTACSETRKLFRGTKFPYILLAATKTHEAIAQANYWKIAHLATLATTIPSLPVSVVSPFSKLETLVLFLERQLYFNLRDLEKCSALHTLVLHSTRTSAGVNIFRERALLPSLRVLSCTNAVIDFKCVDAPILDTLYIKKSSIEMLGNSPLDIPFASLVKLCVNYPFSCQSGPAPHLNSGICIDDCASSLKMLHIESKTPIWGVVGLDMLLELTHLRLNCASPIVLKHPEKLVYLSLPFNTTAKNKNQSWFEKEEEEEEETNWSSNVVPEWFPACTQLESLDIEAPQFIPPSPKKMRFLMTKFLERTFAARTTPKTAFERRFMIFDFGTATTTAKTMEAEEKEKEKEEEEEIPSLYLVLPATLTKLKCTNPIPDLSFILSDCPNLTDLCVSNIDAQEEYDMSEFANFFSTQLTRFEIVGTSPGWLNWVRHNHHPPCVNLVELVLRECIGFNTTLETILGYEEEEEEEKQKEKESMFPNLQKLVIISSASLENLKGITILKSSLRHLSITYCKGVRDISHIQDCFLLETFELIGSPLISDLYWLLVCRTLRDVCILHCDALLRGGGLAFFRENWVAAAASFERSSRQHLSINSGLTREFELFKTFNVHTECFSQSKINEVD